MRFCLPKEVIRILGIFHQSGFQAYPVGGCVRDVLQEKNPSDWDITTNAKPEDIQKLFPKSFYENSFGTVSVLTGSRNLALQTIEITPFRREERYSDFRHPDVVTFTDQLEDDLKRRDFTINAIALDVKKGRIIDVFNGVKDLKGRRIRAVGNPEERFGADALRLLRAVRFAVTMAFEIEEETFTAMKKKASLLSRIASERIRDELLKIVGWRPEGWKKKKVIGRRVVRSNEVFEEELNTGSARAFELLRESGILAVILPELEEGYGVTQNKHHIYTVWEHNLRAFTYAVKEDFSTSVRIAALFHDIGKPRCKQGEGPDSTFYNHDVVGAKMARNILRRLKFSEVEEEAIVLFVRYHLFQSDPEKITEAAVRRILRNVGADKIWKLLEVRLCDRIGSGVPKAEPYRLRKFYVMVERAMREPISLKQLKINGGELMGLLRISSGPRVGFILNALMNEVIEDPKKNTPLYLKKHAKELHALSDAELQKASEKAKCAMNRIEIQKEEVIKKQYGID